MYRLLVIRYDVRAGRPRPALLRARACKHDGPNVKQWMDLNPSVYYVILKDLKIKCCGQGEQQDIEQISGTK